MTSSNSAVPTEIVSFGPFRLCTVARRLERDGAQVDIGSRAFDLLIALVEHAGEPVRNRELLARVWRDMVVEESSLRVNIAGLRRALGDGIDGARYIVNIPTQGYCLAVPISRLHVNATPTAATQRDRPVYPLPARLKRMVGRDAEIADLSARVQAGRFVSIVGPGGMGKTTVAIAIAHVLLAPFEGEVCFVDLAVLASPELLGGTVAATLGLKLPPGDPMPGLLSWLRDKKILLILDNCEHLIDAAAAFAERLLEAGPDVHLVATSREALRAEGEYAYRLPPLESPPAHAPLSADQALTYPAVQLFVERARANGNNFELDDVEAKLISDICRQLDGIALAIELGASRVAAFGVRGTAELLGNRFRLTWQGRRTALPRHQTLSAMLDWSYNLLPEPEREVLRRLSTFAGPFSLDAAQRIAIDPGTDPSTIPNIIESLVAKSLATIESDQPSARYRLLESARVYAADKLRSSGEGAAIARRHAAYVVDYFSGQRATFSAFPVAGVASGSIDMLANLRACLQWCFAPDGDVDLGMTLCAVGAPVLVELSLLGECQKWTARALACLPETTAGAREEVALQEAFAISAMFATGNSNAVLRAIERGLELATALGDQVYELRLLAGMNIFMTRIGNFQGALEIAERSTAVAATLGLPEALAMAEWMLGVAHHLIGDQALARQYCESGLARVAGMPRMNTLCFGYDHRIRAQVALARALWLSGHADRAVGVAWEVIRAGEKLGHPISYCIALIYAIPVFIWTGQWEAAEELTECLMDHTEGHLLVPYLAVAKGLKGELLVKRGAAAEGVALLQECIQVARANHHQILSAVQVAALAEGFNALGRHDEALATIEPAVSIGEAVFNAPDILRIRGEVLAAMPAANLAAAEACLLRAVDCARRQHACGWALRTTTSLSRLLARRGRAGEARDLLSQVLGAQREGFDSVDYQDARCLLARLADA
jgi:predicted ATPase/DNA-binding winged helix-turn-helix (wHTH) protein